MSKIYKSNYVKINEPRKLENVFPARFPSVEKKNPDDLLMNTLENFAEESQSAEDESNAREEDTVVPVSLSEAEEEAERIIEEAKELYKNIVSEANREAQEMLSKANDESESITDKAYESGYNSGINDARNRIGNLIVEAQEIRDFLDSRREKQILEIEKDTIELILAVARKVIGCELEQNEQAVISLVRSALTKNSFAERATLRVSQEDYKIIEPNKISILRSVEGLSDLEVLEDIAIQRGAYIVDTPSGEINASVEVQLRELGKIFEFILRNDI